jgi:hypothetical protein
VRKELSKMENVRSSFVGTFKRYGTKTNYNGFPEKTILLVDIKSAEGRAVSDHLWFNFTKQFEKLGELKEGDIVSFDARVRTYIKGYVNFREEIDNRELDYRLSHPTKVEILKKGVDKVSESD